MNILIDIGHPAHVHLFKHFAHEMVAKGHLVHFTCRNREFVLELLEEEGLPYTSFGNNFRTPVGKIWGLFLFTAKMFGICRKFRPDILISHSSMYTAFAAFLIRKPHISFEDTFNFEQVRLYKPFTAAILTGAYDHPLKSKKVVRYHGYHELAYLHPNRFTPDPSGLHELFPQNTPSEFGSASPSEAAQSHTPRSPIEAWVCKERYSKCPSGAWVCEERERRSSLTQTNTVDLSPPCPKKVSPTY